MNTIIISKHKRKLLLITAAVIIWILLIIGAEQLLDSTVIHTICVDSTISLSYPATISIKKVYSKFSDAAPYIQASNNDYKKFIEFKSPEEGFEFSYPQLFKLDQQSFSGSEILYHIDFQNKNDKKIYGFLQVWKISQSLEQFLEVSKEAAMTEFHNFSSKKITVNGLEGYFWEYSADSANGRYKSLEVFLSKGTKFYRISFYIPETEYGKNDYDMFWKMVKSFKAG